MRQIPLLLLLACSGGLTAFELATGPATGAAAIPADPEEWDLQQRYSYLFGINLVGEVVRRRMDPRFVILGLTDGLARRKPKVDLTLAENIAQAYQEEVEAEAEQAMLRHRANGEAYLAKARAIEGAVTTDSGLVYEVLRRGQGQQPTEASRVRVHYEGRFPEGKVFDSSYNKGQPQVLGLGGIIPGWREALLQMPSGSKWRLHIPSELAYGERGRPPVIPPHSVLVFDIELLGIE